MLKRNLSLMAEVAQKADITLSLAFKAYALWRTFPIFREYVHSASASSLWEARMGFEEFGAPCHTFSPAYITQEIADIARYSQHLAFNSLSQYERLHGLATAANPKVSVGLRVNPQYSEVETALYNPCSPGTRFGVSADKLPRTLPSDIRGFLIHNHCESSAEAFARSLQHVEEKFGQWLPQLQWINFGGGHLMTRKGYNVDLLVSTLNEFHRHHPNLQVILEPGSAFAWQTGTLVAQVVDIVEDSGICTAVMNVSFTCHMPDCLEMPYWPEVRGAKTIPTPPDTPFDKQRHTAAMPHTYRLGGGSCLSGDYLGFWQFGHELAIGENIVFEDMLHYTTVKTTMFNGVFHPDIALQHSDGSLEYLRRFTYDDYKQRMD